jgi:4-amino-4-deoxychorismate lyase
VSDRVDATESPTEIAVPERLVAVLGRGLVPADTPILRADDLGALRGDGIFETLHVRQGRPWILDEHLRRMSGSAARLDLALPPAKVLAELIDVMLADWPADVEGAARLVCTRGAEAGSDVTVFATVTPIGPSVVRSRREGITVATASLGLTADARERAPWLLGGAKTISYAVNMAALRWAQAQGVDDVLWVSADGFALEGPTSTLIWLDGTTLCTVPAETTGILAGTTARWLLERADKFGYDAEERMITPAALAKAAGAWFASSVRGVVEVRAIDGVAMAATKDTVRMRDLLGFGA